LILIYSDFAFYHPFFKLAGNVWLDEAIGILTKRNLQNPLSQSFYLFLSFHFKSSIENHEHH